MATGRLLGKAAIVTGGGSGIGRATCQAFAREGARVAVVDINTDGASETIKSLPGQHEKHCLIQADVSSAEQAKQAVKSAEERLGQRSTILVNNAGIIREGFLAKMNEKTFDDVIRVNLKGVFLMAKEFVISLREPIDGLPGSIVNISSIAGKAGFGKQSNYCASKAGVLGMTKTIAMEYGKYNIRCNAVLPGLITTPMADDVPEGHIKALSKLIPMKRFGKPEEVANVCLFLASEESSYVNGACFEVTGGLAA